ncbi:MAG: TonB-dependent receptor [Robiginitomaculum sp.]|nr:TonB-dependent receptor [Robiginitomaculum sp.]MDQ7078842.1 TonB-dependent receptor [Robiginitomaculum sp.]
MPKKLTLLASIAILSTFAFPAFSEEETSRESEIIIIGSHTPIPMAEMTAAISIIEGPDVTDLGNVFAADALRAIPGVSVNRSGPAGSLTQVRLRGSEANHVLVLVDGIEASNPFSGEFSFSTLPADGISRIEVLRGEQSALWGSDAIGGVINFITTPTKRGNTFGAFAEYGSFGTVRTGANGQFVSGDTRLFGNLSYGDSTGYDVSATGGDKDGYDNFTAHGGFDAPLGDVASLKTRTRYTRAHSQFDADTDFDGRLNDAPLSLQQSQFDALAQISAQSMDGHLNHELKTTYTNTEDLGGTSRSIGFRTQGSYQLAGNWDTGTIAHHLTLLAEGTREIYKNDGGPGAFQNQKQRNTGYALAADYRLVSGDLVLNASARRDTHSLFADADTWRVGGAYAFESLGGRLRASAGQGVKNPGFFELFGFFPAFFTGNPNLKAERSTGYELGWDQQIGPAKVSISGYTSRLKNEIFTDFGTFPATARNRTGTSHRKGIEIEGNWPVNEALRLTGSATFQRTTQNTVREIRRPKFLASAAFHWQPSGQPIGISLGADHNGAMTDTDFGTFSTVTLKAYTLVHGTISYDLGERVQFYVRGDNLLNEKYSDVFGFAGQKRGVYGGIRAQF